MEQTTPLSAHGKLLLTGEYLVMKGALALALPAKFGQQMIFKTTKGQHQIHWKAEDINGKWFEALINLPDFKVINSSDEGVSNLLTAILKACQSLSPKFLEEKKYYSVDTNLEFDKNWGLGSSSTLIALLSQIAQVNPYMLNNLTFKSSGFDIACAFAVSPVFYRLTEGIPEVTLAGFNPPFHEKLFFIYSGKKQDSRASYQKSDVADFASKRDIELVSELSREIAKVAELQLFNSMIKEHELLLSKILKQNTIKKEYFSNFDGELKSLGAWGGDFILAATNRDKSYVDNYFNNKGLKVIFNYVELIR